MISNKKKVLKNDERCKPIVFVNNPITTEKEDVIGLSGYLDTVNQAINDDSTMIGVIADYGTGKSSMNELLINEARKKKWPLPVKINMWDSISDITNEENINSNISNLTKSFLFQLANGHDTKFGGYINKLLSKNYGNISFATNNLKKIVLFGILSAICVAIYTIGGLSGTGITKYIPEDYHFLLSIIKVISPSFLIIAIVLGILGIINISIAYSHWKMPASRNPEINDVFDVYNIIINHLSHHSKNGKKQLIFIDDLDRINDKELIISFLKEIYRFQDSIGINNKSFVFIISVKPESELETKTTQQGQKNKYDLSVYSKIFDTTVSLKPIHFDDYDAALLRLIKSDTEKRKAFEELINIKFGNTLPEDFIWVKKGNNLTLRVLKDRLNNAIAIYVSLRNQSYKNSAATFKSCAAVSYLENQYPKDYYKLIKNEVSFSEFMKSSYQIVNDSLREEGLKKLSNNFKKQFDGKEFDSSFVNDLCDMVKTGIFNDDYRMYFYTYPKDSHIKTTEEREICDCLLYPNQYPNCEDLDGVVQSAYKNGNNITVENTLKMLSEYPLIILENDILFNVATKISLAKTFETFDDVIEISYNQNIDCSYLWARVLTLPDDIQIKFIEMCIESISQYSEEDIIIKIREEIITGTKEEIIKFKNLFISDDTNLPVIKESEIQKIDNVSISLSLIDCEKLEQEQFSYISELIIGSKLTDNDLSISLKIMKLFAQMLSAKETAESFLCFLSTNCICDNSLFREIIQSDVESIKISNYLNKLDIDIIPDEYFEMIENAKMSENLKTDIINGLMKRGCFVSALLSLVDNDRLMELQPYIAEVEKIKDACQNISNDGKENEIIILRDYLYFDLLKQEYFSLFMEEYPLVTTDEIKRTKNFDDALHLVNATALSNENSDIIIDIFSCYTLNNDDIISFFELFYDKDSDYYIIDSEARLSILQKIDYKKIGFNNLEYNDRSTVYACINDDIDTSSFANAIKWTRIFFCFIPEIEVVIQEKANDSANELEYFELIKEIDELSDTALNWLKTDGYISVGLNERMQQQLYNNEDYENYIIAKMLNEGRMIIDERIPFSHYLNVYKDVIEVFGIMSEHWDFLEKFQKETDFSSYDDNHLVPAFKTKQCKSFFEYIFSTQKSDELKLKYLNEFGSFQTEEDSKAFQLLMAKDENMALLGDYTLYNRIHERLWSSNPTHKAQFTKIWNKKWKDKLVVDGKE